jgi:3-hydroxyisobutyrate dehydrogenase
MDLVLKDVSLFYGLAERTGLKLELAPMLIDLFRDGIERYGERELSPNIIRRLEESANVEVLGQGFPAQMTDDEPEVSGYEVVIAGRQYQ